ncbi:hypothetical protein [Flavobacterium sp. UBA6135]|uniref:hypothetical protein n=1 Tax=Flavobacterium sp. UBA6135 TaxID=1946553 RepID=UPI0025C2C59C|nr:hypothetical protein [Flavobacterium sp. UBA6135]
MTKNVIICLSLLVTFISVAQDNTASPYSFYGIGEFKFKGAVENRNMGGVAAFKDSLSINFLNPASYANLKITAFSVSGSHNTTTLENSTQSEKAQRTSLDYLAVGLPLGKSSAVFGLMPYTSVGYRIRNAFNDDEGFFRNKIASGRGGVNRLFFGYGYSITPDFSIGVDINYLFGNVETTSLEYITGVQLGTREINNSRITGFGYNLGLMYNKKVTESYSVYTSLSYSPESELAIKNSTKISTVNVVIPESPSDVEIEDEILNKNKINNPGKISFGLGFGDTKKFGIGTQFTFTQNNEFGNRLDGINNVTFENGTKIGVGGYFIPKIISYSNYWKRVTYRGGMSIENTGLIINNQEIKDYGINFGLGLPASGTLSNINIGFEFGSRGTRKANLIKENYFNILVSLSLSDKWFVKSKYN